MKKTRHISKTSGTREWAAKTVNCCTGCSHDCLYCYAKGMAVRFGQVTAGQWPTETMRQNDVIGNARKVSRQGNVPVIARHHSHQLCLPALTVLEKLWRSETRS